MRTQIWVKGAVYASILSTFIACGDEAKFSGSAPVRVDGSKEKNTGTSDQTVNPGDTPPSPVAAAPTTPASPTPNPGPGSQSVVFGDQQVFRVGDGVAYNTSCIEGLDSYKLSGTKYTFSFQVLEDNTSVLIKINRVCGVDIADSNTATITGPNGAVQSIVLKKDQTDVSFASAVLNKGDYALVVESLKIKSGPYTGEWDDFIVGDIHVNADKKLIPGTVSAQ